MLRARLFAQRDAAIDAQLHVAVCLGASLTAMESLHPLCVATKKEVRVFNELKSHLDCHWRSLPFHSPTPPCLAPCAQDLDFIDNY